MARIRARIRALKPVEGQHRGSEAELQARKGFSVAARDTPSSSVDIPLCGIAKTRAQLHGLSFHSTCSRERVHQFYGIPKKIAKEEPRTQVSHRRGEETTL